MADPKKQCNTCQYWRKLISSSKASTAKCCHYILVHEKQRVEIDGICKSYEKAEKKK